MKRTIYCMDCGDEKMVEIGNVGIDLMHKWHYKCPKCKKKVCITEDIEDDYIRDMTKKLKKEKRINREIAQDDVNRASYGEKRN